jgi:cytoskeletal protein CcmA (bactofilin family)
MAIGRTGWERLEIGRRLTRRRSAAAEALQDSTAAASQTPAAECDTAFINEGCEIEGKLVLKNSLRVQGEFKGRIETGKTVTVDERATVAGDIQARTVIIYGAVVGNVDATREVVLHAGGRLHGNVKTPAFELERGAFFNGQTEMYRPERVLQSQHDEDLSCANTTKT